MISAQIRAQVRQRAQNACEYCHLHQDDSPLAALHVEHIIPKIHGGSDDVENLALACIDCNLHKGTNLTGFDPETNVITELFHPRRPPASRAHNLNYKPVLGFREQARSTLGYML